MSGNPTRIPDWLDTVMGDGVTETGFGFGVVLTTVYTGWGLGVVSTTV